MTITVSAAPSPTQQAHVSEREDISQDTGSPFPISEPVACGTIAVVDICIFLASGVAAASVADVDLTTARYLVGLTAVLGAVIGGALCIVLGAYRFSALAKIKNSFALAAAGLAIMIATQFVFAVTMGALDQVMTAWLLIWPTVAAPLLALSRLAMSYRLTYWRQSGRLSERVAIVGATSLARTLIHSLGARHSDATAPQIIGVFDDRRKTDSLNESAAWKSRAPMTAMSGTIDDLIGLIRRNRVDVVIIAISLSAADRITELLAKFQFTPVDIRLCPDHTGLQLGQFSVSKLGQHSLLNAVDKPLRHWRQVVKNVEDMTLGLIILLMITPVMAVIAFAIKLESPGPALFRQKRLGYNNGLINVLKFRTMHHAMCDANADQLTTRNDPRVTKVGAFLRRTSLDELPQFINVLRGDMSIVGPRPHALSAKAGGIFYQEAVPAYDARHRMKPGITGWAQVNGWRGETRTVEHIVKRVEHDLFYVKSWSVAMDLKIIIRTVFGGFTGTSAY